jgi:1,2-beta-oligoglucan phosphorylase
MILKNSTGLNIGFLENGSVKSIEADPIRISLKSATLFSKSGTNIYLRQRKNPIEFIALLGPESEGRFRIEDNMFVTKGSWDGLEYLCMLRLSETSLSWQWQVEVKNTSGQAVELDLVYMQDIALKPINSGLINEYYVSQYLERRILEDKKFGSVICCRQNMREDMGHPWVMMACQNGAVSASTDGIQFFGKTFRETGIPEGLMVEHMGGECAGESSVFALQEKPFKLSAGETHKSSMVATYLPDHPKATSEEDMQRLPELITEFENDIAAQSKSMFLTPVKNLFTASSFLPVDDLNEQELNSFFGEERRHTEKENGRLLSFFNNQNNHIVLRAKEVITDRPHAHIMQAKAGFVPDENIVSTTSFAFGVFSSHLTQGNTNFNVLLSVCTSQFNQTPESGQRIFIEIDGRHFLLGVPSAFEMGLNHCRWIYKHGEYCFQVLTWTSKKAPQVNLDFRVLSGNPVNLIITHDFDPLNGWSILPGIAKGEYIARPYAGSMIAEKFPESQFRFMVQSATVHCENYSDKLLSNSDMNHGNPLFALSVQKTSEFCLSIVGEVVNPAIPVRIENADKQWLSDCEDAWKDWKDLSLNLDIGGNQGDISAIREILPWYGMNALVHFLTPYGLEQFGGAAWGTRDVSQGPVDLLITMEKYDEARKVLCTIFSNQNPDGGWPQWWMFDSYQNIRAHEAHGDIFYWCIIALGNYIKVTGDLTILDEVLPYYHEKGIDFAEKKPLSEHIERLIKMIVDSFIPGTALVPFGGGDWNDSLQPVSKELAQRLISSWTVEMNYQAFSEYQKVYKLTANEVKAEELKTICEKIKSDFNKYLVKDGIVAGYGLTEPGGSISVLLHPDDKITGIRYSLLPMERGILSGIFTREQAEFHGELIEKHLKGPDGARLMDRPLRYKGGIQEIFQRAESSTFFGREIGLMYVHEHIRYAELLAGMGKAEALVKALRQAIPVGYREVVPCGDFRQSNCYYSSSDVTFKNRYEADDRYDEVKTGNIALKGGWRVYSSGPGIYIGLIITRLLGLRIESGNVIIDPVMPFSMNGISATLNFMGYPVLFRYRINENNFSPKAISINGKVLNFTNEENRCRQGGAIIPKNQFLSMLNLQENIVVLEM